MVEIFHSSLFQSSQIRYAFTSIASSLLISKGLQYRVVSSKLCIGLCNEIRYILVNFYRSFAAYHGGWIASLSGNLNNMCISLASQYLTHSGKTCCYNVTTPLYLSLKPMASAVFAHFMLTLMSFFAK